MFNNQFIFSKIKFLRFSLKKIIFLIWIGYETGSRYPIPDRYKDGIINFKLSGIGYEYGDMLGSRDKGLWRQYPYSPHPIAMSTYCFSSSTLYSIQPCKLYDYGFSGSLMCHVSCHVGHVPCVWACA